MQYVDPFAPRSSPLRSVPPDVEYHRVLARDDKRQIIRGVLALVLLMAGLFVFAMLVQKLGALVDTVLGRDAFVDGRRVFTPVSHAFSLLSVSLLIPWSMFLQRWLYGVPGSSLTSVLSRFRWDVFGRALMVMLPLWVLFFTVPHMMGDAGVKSISWSHGDLIAMLAVIILLTPLQAAAEEYSMRGLAFRVGASWVRDPRLSLGVGIAVSSVLFMAGHLSSDLWLIIYYLLFGAGAAIITWRTGGLETSSVLHSIYNAMTFLVTLVLHGNMGEGLNREAGKGSPAVVLLGLVICLVAAAYWYATRKSGSARTPS